MLHPSFTAVAVPNIPLIKQGDDLVAIIIQALNSANLNLNTDDILVISSKIVSKSEGRKICLADVTPGSEALALAEKTQKDPRIVELILQESKKVSRAAPGVLVTEHNLGFVSANAGIDQSNVDATNEHVLLLPRDPDSIAHTIREQVKQATQQAVAVVITDTHGRPFRLGNVGVAIGVAGMQALTDFRGQNDLFGRELRATIQGYADMIASAAHLLTGEGSEGLPVVLISGLVIPQGDGQASDLYRPAERDLYR